MSFFKHVQLHKYDITDKGITQACYDEMKADGYDIVITEKRDAGPCSTSLRRVQRVHAPVVRMKFLVTDIKFDFNTDMPDYYSVSYDDQELIVRDNIGVWEADDEDDLIEEITANAGWCILSIDYEIQLK